MEWSRTSSPACRASSGCSSSPAIRASPTRARRRHQAGRPRTRCPLCARRQRAQGGEPHSYHRPADRRCDRRASLGRPVRRRRSRTSSSFRIESRECRRSDRAEAATRRKSSAQAQATGQSGRLRLLSCGVAHCIDVTRKASEEAERCLAEAMELDPDFALRMGAWPLGAITALGHVSGWSSIRAEDAEAARLAQRALRLTA